jgi:hypothetical protein
MVMHVIFCVVMVMNETLYSRNCPQYFGTGLVDQEGTRRSGSAAWISRTSKFVRSDLENSGELQLVIRAPLVGESASCQMQGESVSWVE